MILERGVELEGLDTLHVSVVSVDFFVLVADVEVGVGAVETVAMLSRRAAGVPVGLESARGANSSCLRGLALTARAHIRVHLEAGMSSHHLI